MYLSTRGDKHSSKLFLASRRGKMGEAVECSWGTVEE